MQIYNKYFNLPNYFAFFVAYIPPSLSASVGFTLHQIKLINMTKVIVFVENIVHFCNVPQVALVATLTD